MSGSSGLSLVWLTSPGMVDSETRSRLLACWRDVSNAGGAVGFPFPPVGDPDIGPVVDAMVGALDPLLNLLLVAVVDERLGGWLLLVRNESAVARHWARVLRVQTALEHRGTGVGRALMTEVARAARDDLGLTALHLELRGGEGLESFYEKLGWSEVGRWPSALHLGGDDYRDEVLMILDLV